MPPMWRLHFPSDTRATQAPPLCIIHRHKLVMGWKNPQSQGLILFLEDGQLALNYFAGMKTADRTVNCRRQKNTLCKRTRKYQQMAGQYFTK